MLDVFLTGWFNTQAINGVLLPRSERIMAQANETYDHGLTLLFREDYLGAEKVMRQIIQQTPKDAKAHTVLGVALIHQNRLSDAIDSLNRALEINPRLVEAYSNLGDIYAFQRKYPESVAQFQKGIAINPNDANLRNGLAVTLHEMGNFDAAIEQYQAAIRLNPNHPSAPQGLLAASNRIPTRTSVAETELPSKSPHEAKTYFKQGEALYLQGKLDKAIANYRTSLKIDPNQPVVYNSLGLALRRQGKLDEAIEAYRQALQLNPDLADAHVNLAIPLLDQGKLEQAIASLQRARALLKSQNQDPEVVIWIEQMLKKLQSQ